MLQSAALTSIELMKGESKRPTEVLIRWIWTQPNIPHHKRLCERFNFNAQESSHRLL